MSPKHYKASSPRLKGCLLAASFLAIVPGLRPDHRDDVDFTRLKNEYGASLPNGSGVRMLQVEFIRDNTWATASSGDLAGKTFTYLSSTAPTSFSDHAYQVGCYLGGPSSLTPGLPGWKVSEAWTFTGAGNLNGPKTAFPIAATWDIENHSWGGNDVIFALKYLYKQDYRIERDNVIACVGVDNSSTLSMLFGNSYNSIAVGTSTGNHPQTGTTLDTSGRMKPDLVGTATWTSYATPIVASSAALLVGEINRTPALAAARNPVVVKALLMAGATKEEFAGWSHSSQQPLDRVYGAGEVNIYHSYKMLVAGQQVPSGSSEVGRMGWDSNTTPGSGRRLYFFSVPAGKRMLLSAVLAWNRHVVPDAYWQNPTLTLQNLDLVLWHSANYTPAGQVSRSSSTIDNVEHIYERTLLAGQYALEVVASASGERYGLAWRSTLVDDPNSLPTTTIPVTTIPTTVPTTTVPTTTTTVATTSVPTTTVATTTIPTTIPTTIRPTTIATTVPTTIPLTTIPTTVPTTTVATTTIRTTTPTTSIRLTTVPVTSVPTTVPTTTVVTTTVSTTIPRTTIPTTIPGNPSPQPTTSVVTTMPTTSISPNPGTGFETQYRAADVGTVGTAGATTYDASSASFRITGAGVDIGGLADSFQFAASPVTGNTEMVVKVTGFAAGDSNARAGLMLRESSASTSAFAGVFVSGSGTLQFVRRTTAGTPALVTSGQSTGLPIYLKLVRRGDLFGAYYSADGANWSTLGSVEAVMRSVLDGGLAVCSKNPAQIAILQSGCPAVNLGTSSPSFAGLQLFDVGASCGAAAASANGELLSLRGCGYVLPGTSREALALLAKRNNLDLTVATEVLPSTGVVPARAGLMMREGVADNARFVSLAVDNQGRVVFEYRTAPGAFAVSRILPESARHLLLDRRGATLSAMVSNDGVNWRTVASVTLSFRQVPLVGLMTISSSTNAPATANFDGFDLVTR